MVATDSKAMLAYGLVIGGIIGFAIAKLIDPPPRELVEAVAESPWAEAMADFYIPADLPKEEREKLKEEIKHKLAERMLRRWYRE